jgi:hypothetical protein
MASIRCFPWAHLTLDDDSIVFPVQRHDGKSRQQRHAPAIHQSPDICAEFATRGQLVRRRH